MTRPILGGRPGPRPGEFRLTPDGARALAALLGEPTSAFLGGRDPGPADSPVDDPKKGAA